MSFGANYCIDQLFQAERSEAASAEQVNIIMTLLHNILFDTIYKSLLIDSHRLKKLVKIS